MTNVVDDHGADPSGLTDSTAAFVSAIEAQRAKRAYLPKTGGGTLNIAAGGIIDVPAGVYVLSDFVKLQQREHLRCEAGTFLSFSAGGLVLDSFYTQSQADVEVSGRPSILSTYGGIGFHAQGGGFSRIEANFGGWDTCVKLEGSNGLEIVGPIFASWENMGNPHPIGVHFATPGAGGACNGNSVLGAQFNACSIGVWSEDGQGNTVHGNFNSCGEVARIEGTQGLKISGEAEGCTSDAYFRLGPPGGYGQARIVAQSLDLSGFSVSRNEAHSPAFMRLELLAQAWSVRLDGGKSLGAPAGPVIGCGSPWPTIPYVMIRDLYRSGWLMGGSKPTAAQLFDRQLYGIDHGA